MSLLGEFKRRKVFQVAVMYAVVAWLLVQVIVNVEAPLNLPDWSDTLVIVLLAIGFPIALLLAWIFDFTSRGVEITPRAASESTAPRGAPAIFTYVVQGLVLLAVGFLIVDQYVFDADAPATTSSSERPAALSTQGEIMQFTAALPAGIRFAIGEDFWRSASISPDGRNIVFAGTDLVTGTDGLYVRPVRSAEAVLLPGTVDGNAVFWSPDSRSIGFYSRGELKVTSLAGGTPRRVADATSRGGGAWSTADVILANLSNPGPIFRVPQDGGDPVPVTALDPAVERDHLWPQFLDDGDHFLYVATGRTGAEDKVFVGSLSSDARTLLLDGVTTVVYASPSYLLFLDDGVLMGQVLDTSRMELVGQPVPIASNVQSPLSASHTGALAYRAVSSAPMPMVWVRPDGTEIGSALPPGYYSDPAISPDGTEVAFASRESRDRPFDISILTLANGAVRQLTLSAANERAPLWAPDGETLVFLSFTPGAPGIYRKAASGAGAEELVLPSPGVAWPYQWPGNELHYFAGISGNNGLWTISPDRGGGPTLLLETRYNEVDGAVSPDGQWYAYSQNETGRFQIYVSTFPLSSTKLVVTTQGGADPFWSRDGTELYYIRPSTAELMSVEVIPGDPPRFGAHRRIHSGPLFYPDAHTFYLHPDGERILLAPSSAPVGDITVLLNWQSAIP